MTTTYDTDPNTQTVAAAWASSPLGQPDREVHYSFATPDTSDPFTADEEPPTAKRVMLAAGLACGIAAVALVGVMFFVDTDSSQPTVMAPGPAPQNAVIVGPSTTAPAPKPVVAEQSTAPIIVAPAPRVAPPPVAPSTANVATPPPVAPQGDTTVVIDIPPLPEKPDQQDPEPPKPPVLIDPNVKLPEPPKPKPPISVPDLTLAAKPPKPPVLIDPVFGP